MKNLLVYIVLVPMIMFFIIAGITTVVTEFAPKQEIEGCFCK